uniref:G-protein coupled receptors family 1 profile domain-containing protein n=1 Tax=Ascaris lumbricoides TaxID=6252 RepID=A0A9J2PUR5_ASCLU
MRGKISLLVKRRYVHWNASVMLKIYHTAVLAQDYSDEMENCTYRYTGMEESLKLFSLWMDGPVTMAAVVLAFIGAHFAIRFLARAAINKELTASLYLLCLSDSLLMSSVFFFYSIEATGQLLLNENLMWQNQSTVRVMHGIASFATTASTLLVTYVTFQRFLVVHFPLRYASIPNSEGRRAQNQKASSYVETDSKRLSADREKVIRKKCSSSIRKRLRPFAIPSVVILCSFALNVSVFFEFTVSRCFNMDRNTISTHLKPTDLRNSKTYNGYRAVVMMVSQTIAPISLITLLTMITEYRVYQSLQQRRRLFENQQRLRSVLICEELKETVSRTVSIFIAVKFIILRSLPLFFDVYEIINGIEAFGFTMSILVRISDFAVVLNSATNSLAYFGKRRWLEKRLRTLLLKMEERKIRKMSSTERQKLHRTLSSNVKISEELVSRSSKNSTSQQVPI